MKIKARPIDPRAVRSELIAAQDQLVAFNRASERLSAEQIRSTAQMYQQLCARYSNLETFFPGTVETSEALRLVMHGRRLLYGSRLSENKETKIGFLKRAQNAFGLIWPYVLASFLLFVLGALTASFLVFLNPAFAWHFISEEGAQGLLQGKLWTEQVRGMSALASSSIATNNIKVTFSAFALGITGGIGTVAILFFNGWHIGGLFVVTAQYDMATKLLEFVYAHGFLELSIIFVSGGCGLYIGDSLIRPGSLSRKVSLQRGAKTAVDLLLFGALCLIPSGVVEGYVSPYDSVPVTVKLVLGLFLGGCYWVFLIRGLRMPTIDLRP